PTPPAAPPDPSPLSLHDALPISLGVAAGNPMGLGISEQDSILPVVPMFHANAWGYPYLATALGAKLVYPGPHLDPESLLDDFVRSEEHTSELQSLRHLVCRLLLE